LRRPKRSGGAQGAPARRLRGMNNERGLHPGGPRIPGQRPGPGAVWSPQRQSGPHRGPPGGGAGRARQHHLHLRHPRTGAGSGGCAGPALRPGAAPGPCGDRRRGQRAAHDRPAARQHRRPGHPHPQAPYRAAHPDPGRLYPGADPVAPDLRAGTGRHRQDLSRRRPGGRHDGGGRGRPHHPVAAGGGGGRAAGLPARRSQGQGRSLSAAAL